ncbi:hypothetical protein ISG33_14470 [Glaciecola sp. MH2013]|uniref:hypothetical protein n=1 Tax=Glaciecola sp. MH2013 TaxID=2785524 RepID=UPI00189F53EE|nr:hypothetical protein [Glaciecola sp. MH2013]MBF7074607.1 hypothetical protein [Glaciecola sp. MH2013]
MHEYFELKEQIVNLLTRNGFDETHPHTNSDVYGSMYCVYSKNDERFMIEWDGEEGFGNVQRWLGDNQWEILKPLIVESSREAFDSQINALLKVITTHL